MRNNVRVSGSFAEMLRLSNEIEEILLCVPGVFVFYKQFSVFLFTSKISKILVFSSKTICK